jgi:phosphoribosylglycinamide formyltransferase 1
VRIGWLSSGRDAAACTLLAEVAGRARREGLNLDIAVVFCDRERGEQPQSDAFLDLARDLGLTSVTLSSAASWGAWRARRDDLEGSRLPNKAAVREAWRMAFHDDVAELLDSYGVELLVLAGYMLITSPDMCERYPILNLHPALPGGPQGTWQAVIWQLLADEARETGAMVHLATAELDRGPVVAYCAFPIVGLRWDRLWHAFRRQRDALGIDGVAAAEGERQPLFAEIRRQGERREIPLLYHTVREFALEHFVVRDGEIVGVTVEAPLELTAAVDAELDAEERGSSVSPAGGGPGSAGSSSGSPGGESPGGSGGQT